VRPSLKRNRPLHRAEGIIVKTIDYQEYDTILHVFTKNEGMRSFIAKRARHPRSRGTLPSSPLTHAEFVFENPDKPLPICREISPVSYYLSLRKDIDSLTNACKMACILHETLLPGKAAPLLFGLFKCYLDQMAKSQGSQSLVASFLLKFLRHEGVFTLPLYCTECDQELTGFYVCHHGFFCCEHAPERTLFFSNEEQQMLHQLMYSRQFSLIMQLSVEERFLLKIESLYKKLKVSF
jgi:DNA repair protein RecO